MTRIPDIRKWAKNIAIGILFFSAILLLLVGVEGILSTDRTVIIIAAAAMVPAIRNIAKISNTVDDRYGNSDDRVRRYSVSIVNGLLYGFLVIPYILASTAGVILMNAEPPTGISGDVGGIAVFLAAAATSYAVSDIITEELYHAFEFVFYLIDSYRNNGELIILPM